MGKYLKEVEENTSHLKNIYFDELLFFRRFLGVKVIRESSARSRKKLGFCLSDERKGFIFIASLSNSLSFSPVEGEGGREGN